MHANPNMQGYGFSIRDKEASDAIAEFALSHGGDWSISAGRITSSDPSHPSHGVYQAFVRVPAEYGAELAALIQTNDSVADSWEIHDHAEWQMTEGELDKDELVEYQISFESPASGGDKATPAELLVANIERFAEANDGECHVDRTEIEDDGSGTYWIYVRVPADETHNLETMLAESDIEIEIFEGSDD